MAVVIDGVDMPRICQECPCFDVIKEGADIEPPRGCEAQNE